MKRARKRSVDCRENGGGGGSGGGGAGQVGLGSVFRKGALMRKRYNEMKERVVLDAVVKGIF